MHKPPIDVVVVSAETREVSSGHWSHPLLILVAFGPGLAVGVGMLALMVVALCGGLR